MDNLINTMIDEGGFLRNTANLFFEDPSAETDPERLLTISRILRLMKQYLVFLKDESEPWHRINEEIEHHTDDLTVTGGRMEYCYRKTKTTCLDGGCYSPETDYYDIIMNTVSDEELQTAKKKAEARQAVRDREYPHGKMEKFQQKITADRPDISTFVCGESLYLEYPFGTNAGLQLHENMREEWW